jgi:pimeloyl-ACP methyl ester carboxylesterase
MTQATTTQSYEEEPVSFPAEEERLLAILTRPTGGELPTAVVLVGGGWYGTSMGPSRLLVRLARRLATAGHPVLRFDFHGVGESSGTIDRFSLDFPFTGDVTAAINCMRDRGFDRIVLVGWCLGARAALASAAGEPAVRGVGLVSVDLRSDTMRGGSQPRGLELSTWRLIRKGLRPRLLWDVIRHRNLQFFLKVLRKKRQSLAASMRTRLRRSPPVPDVLVSPYFLEPFEAAIERHLPMLFLYGDDDIQYKEFVSASAGRLGKALALASSFTSIEVVEGETHVIREATAADTVIERIDAWIRRGWGLDAIRGGNQ